MKRTVFIVTCFLMALSVMSQKAIISFDVIDYNFGKINEDDGKATYQFEFANKGMSPLVINKVQASCGCTTPTWSKQPIEPGKTGFITVTYNPLGRPGVFNKVISVFSNATEEQVSLKIKGEVITKPSSDNNPYPVSFGGLLSKTKVVSMANVEKGKNMVKTVDIQNSTTSPLKPTLENLPTYLTATFSPEVLKPSEGGKLIISLNSKNCPQWGPLSDDIYVVLNGQKKFSEEYKMTVVGNVVEDFSHLTLDQKRKLPIMEVPVKILQFGALKAGSKRVGKIKVFNKGQNPLEIRRLISNYKELNIRQTKMTIIGGKSADILVELNSKNLVDGEYRRTITIQTNDPDNNFMILDLRWLIVK
jgi:hypothetical protein